MRTLIAASTLCLIASLGQADPTMIEQRLWEGVETVQSLGEPTYEDRRQGDRPNRWMTGVTDPVLTVYLPEKPTGAACVIFPGGGYAGLAIDKEGHYPAQWLARRGIVGVVVPYRCGGDKHAHPVPLMDGQRAMRVVRANAEAWKIDPDKIGVLGFSAGGHLAATVATHHGVSPLLAEDRLASVTARANFAVLVYPVISSRAEITHGGSRANLLGDHPGEQLVAQLSADEQVTAETPPTLLIHSTNDQAVPVANAQRFYDACRKHRVPVEMHLYETGGHGYGMWAEKGTVAGWPRVLEAWLATNDYSNQPIN